KVLNWHAARSDDFKSPIVKGMARTKPAEHVRERTLTEDEIRRVWTAATGAYGALVKFILLTGARRSEASQMPREELQGGTWLLPGSRNKTKQDLIRPLAKQALAVLPAKNGKFVFTHRRASPDQRLLQIHGCAPQGFRHVRLDIA